MTARGAHESKFLGGARSLVHEIRRALKGVDAGAAKRHYCATIADLRSPSCHAAGRVESRVGGASVAHGSCARANARAEAERL